MVNYIDLKLKSIAGHTEIVINGQRIKCEADYDRVIERITPAALHEFSSQLLMIQSRLC